MTRRFSFTNKIFLLVAGTAFLAAPAIAQPFNLPPVQVNRGYVKPKPAPRAQPQPQQMGRPGRTRTAPQSIQPRTNANTQNRQGHNAWRNQAQNRNTNFNNGQAYYPPVYPGPNAPLPPQGTYFVPSPYYGWGYGPNGNYGYGYNPNQGFQRGYNNGYVPFQRY